MIKNAEDGLIVHPGSSSMAMVFQTKNELLFWYTVYIMTTKWKWYSCLSPLCSTNPSIKRFAQLNTMPKSAADCATFEYGRRRKKT
ncbi:hypothetical protein niasHT_028779 [Heterodera trifolii]|uniref:Uncharacterized protein n=1 Tax=Heterodera trifolii TaxID=157864 RepID=A0ABD2KQ83_9BILA